MNRPLSASALAPPIQRTLRLLDVTKFYAPGGGGVRTYLDAKVAHFRERSVHHVLVLPGARRRKARRGHTTVYRVPGLPIPFTPGYRFLLSAQELRRIIFAERPDIIEVGSPFFVPLVTHLATRGLDIPTVGFYHADLVRTYVDPYVGSLPPTVQRRIRSLTSRYVRSVYSRFHATVAASASVAEELKSLGLRNVHAVPLGVDLEVFHPRHRTEELRRSLGVVPKVPIALFAGRLCREKGLDVVVEAHRRLPPGSRPHLLFVGEGPSAPRLTRLARERADLTVLPFVSNKEELARIYSSVDLYLAAGPGETFGLAVAEAMASGTPVVGVNSGAVPDRLAGSEAGELYERGKAGSAAAAIERMVARLGPGTRRAARRHAVREFSWSRTFEVLLGLYSALSRDRRAS